MDEYCDAGKSCIPVEQCRYFNALRVKYANGDNSAKDEQIAIERRETDQETGEKLFTFQRQ